MNRMLGQEMLLISLPVSTPIRGRKRISPKNMAVQALPRDSPVSLPILSPNIQESTQAHTMISVRRSSGDMGPSFSYSRRSISRPPPMVGLSGGATKLMVSQVSTMSTTALGKLYTA